MVSGHDVPPLERTGVMVSIGEGMTIFTGDEIVVHRGKGVSENLLPRGVSQSIDRVRKQQIYDRDVESIMVIFRNGNHATVFLHNHCPDPIDEKDLQEFRARCLMVHDL